jgi:hypothetical protein
MLTGKRGGTAGPEEARAYPGCKKPGVGWLVVLETFI